MGFLNEFVYRVSRFRLTSRWLHYRHKSLATLPDKHYLRPESSQLVDSQLEPLDGDALRSNTANRISVLEIAPMGSAGDTLLPPFHHLDRLRNRHSPSLQRHDHLPARFLVEQHGCLLSCGTWPNQHTHSVSYALSLIVCDIELPIMRVLCPKPIIARAGLRCSRGPSTFTPVKRSTNRSYDPPRENPRDMVFGSRGRDGLVVQVKEATEIRFDDFVLVGPVCPYDVSST